MIRSITEDSRYSVDEEGNVYGVRGQRLRPYKTGIYLSVTLGHSTKRYVHRLVAEAFLDNPEGKPDVAHLDGNGSNNRLENLRWATESENMSDKKIHGTHTQGEKHGKAKLTDAEVIAIRYCRESGFDVVDIANVFKVSKWTIYDACNLKRRKLADY